MSIQTQNPVWGCCWMLSPLPPSSFRLSFSSTNTANTSASVHGHLPAAPQPLTSSVRAMAGDPAASASTPPSVLPTTSSAPQAWPSPLLLRSRTHQEHRCPLGRQTTLRFGLRVPATACVFHLHENHLQLKPITIAKRQNGIIQHQQASGLQVFFPPILAFIYTSLEPSRSSE